MKLQCDNTGLMASELARLCLHSSVSQKPATGNESGQNYQGKANVGRFA